MITKMLVVVAVFASAIATPALAQRTQRAISPSDFGERQRPQRSVNPSNNDVYVNGQYVGTDPDPSIRAQLQRNYGNQGRW